MLTIVIPLLVMVAGILLWALSANTILRTAGTIMFAVGLFVVVMMMAKVSWRVGEAQGEGTARQCYMSRVRLLTTTYLD